MSSLTVPPHICGHLIHHRELFQRVLVSTSKSEFSYVEHCSVQQNKIHVCASVCVWTKLSVVLSTPFGTGSARFSPDPRDGAARRAHASPHASITKKRHAQIKTLPLWPSVGIFPCDPPTRICWHTHTHTHITLTYTRTRPHTHVCVCVLVHTVRGGRELFL